MSRVHFRLLGIVLGLSLLAACQACPPEARALIAAPDFRDPERAGRTFLAGLACDEGLVEYLCLSESLKERYGATYDLYTLNRHEIREQVGETALRYAFKLEPLQTTVSDAGVLVWWGYRGRAYVGFLMVNQHYFALQGESGRAASAFLDGPLPSVMRIEGRTLSLQLEDGTLRGLRADDFSRLEVGSEWKIEDVLEPQEDQED